VKFRAAIGVLTLAIVVGGLVSWRTADASTPPVVLALGDSVTVGVGDAPGRGGYATRVGDALQPGESEDAPGITVHAPRFVSLAQGGATTQSVLAPNGQLAMAVDEIRERRATPSVNDDVDLIVLSIGGNDLFGPLVQACSNPQSETCAVAISQLPAVFQTVGQNLALILGTLSAEAGEGVTIVVLGYYNSLSACQLSHLAPLAALVLEGPDGEVATGDGFNDVFRSVAAQIPGVVVAETFEEIGAADLVGGTDCLHPNASGHERIAEIVLESAGLAG
jgi:lysophospholipase L1-like esterase